MTTATITEQMTPARQAYIDAWRAWLRAVVVERVTDRRRLLAMYDAAVDARRAYFAEFDCEGA